ncbi:MAG: HAD-IC family P-type ATPase, partial [Erysipelotrichales bacterium]
MNKNENTKEKLLKISRLDQEAVLSELNTTINGLNEDQVEDSRELHGDNTITHDEGNTILKRLFEAFINPFTAILIFLAIVSFSTDVVLPLRAGNPEDVDILTVIIIVSMVLISGILRFVQETRSGNAAAKLTAMITTTTNIERIEEGQKELPLEDVVVGDIIHLAAGDMVPADVRILKAKDLFVSQASLTGESDPLEKEPHL